ncbi:MAG TPA: hypothetical protein VMF09_10245 [Solirubrobacteraceae bacterium]|nr:hypothetical protein [Solirubrobacteraceae bacterium]
MAQISRPFQVALVAVVLFAAIWFFALQGHSSGNGGGSGSSTTASSNPPAGASAASRGSSASSSGSRPAKSPTSAAHRAGAAARASSASHGSKSAAAPTSRPTHVYHGPAPGVEGLTRAIAKAHEANAITKRKDNQLQGKSEKASGEAAPAESAGARASKTTAQPTTAKPTTTKPTTAKPTTTKPGASAAGTAGVAPHGTSSSTIPINQRLIEVELEGGFVAIVMFWNPKGADDVADYRALLQVERSALASHQRVIVEDAPASAIAEYGSITRDVQVYSTPTILVISKGGHALVLTGVQDPFSIDQAIEEARQLASMS